MIETKLMQADGIAHAFNGATERKYWRAVVAGTRVNPEVHFNSRASMVVVVYSIARKDFTVSFTRASAAFGDFLASVYRSMEQILAALKAAGLPFGSALDESAALRIEYDPSTKRPAVHLANLGDPWTEAEPLPFKVPERNNSTDGVDAESTDEYPQAIG